MRSLMLKPGCHIRIWRLCLALGQNEGGATVQCLGRVASHSITGFSDSRDAALPVQEFNISVRFSLGEDWVSKAPGCLPRPRKTQRKWGIEESAGLRSRQLISHLGSCRGLPAADHFTWAAKDEEQRSDGDDSSFSARTWKQKWKFKSHSHVGKSSCWICFFFSSCVQPRDFVQHLLSLA